MSLAIKVPPLSALGPAASPRLAEAKRGILRRFPDNKAPNTIEFPWGMPLELKRRAKDFLTQITDRLAEQSSAYLKNALADEVQPSQYQYVGLASIGPVSLSGDTAVEGALCHPVRRLRAGEWAAICAIEWNNPAPGPAGCFSSRKVLGGRAWSLNFDSINLNTMEPGPAQVFTGVFPEVAPEFLVRAFFFEAPDPGPDAALYETNALFTIPSLPLATAATPHQNLEAPPPFLSASYAPLADGSLRYLVVPE